MSKHIPELGIGVYGVSSYEVTQMGAHTLLGYRYLTEID